MVDFDLKLENEEILLRPLREEDLEKYFQLTSEPDMWRFFTHDLSTIEGLRVWAKPAFEKERLQFTVIEKKTQNILGSTAFGNISSRDQRLEIGWTWLGKAYQGNGINGKVKSLLLNYCFETLDLERVEFKTDVLNLQARRALSNINAIEEGVLRSHTLMTNGRRRDTIYFSILKQEWPYVKRENDW
ncbi:GNAT family N-acetyltransferase [Arthrospiribacter ruber]|uniref:N-acetyltransferase n=1 Tax=Arthrospiribacter ruber TaxID=2487934 RepID=A0A951IVL6_9BACT|nr:GNAT family protein [Arthrospiribacter ruber]MBW3468000.1 N-acetyltransferase [Arthrospiribacter ruber]